jgi:hypothetical protein
MIGGNSSKRPQKVEDTARKLPSSRRFDTLMSQYAITLVSKPGNSELP